MVKGTGCAHMSNAKRHVPPDAQTDSATPVKPVEQLPERLFAFAERFINQAATGWNELRQIGAMRLASLAAAKSPALQAAKLSQNKSAT